MQPLGRWCVRGDVLVVAVLAVVVGGELLGRLVEFGDVEVVAGALDVVLTELRHGARACELVQVAGLILLRYGIRACGVCLLYTSDAADE